MKRLALVGFGRIALKHLEVFRALDCDFVAACNRSEEGRRKAEKEGGIQKTYQHPIDMVEKVQPDAVICCPSFDSVYDVASKLIPYGVPLLLEKPPGVSVKEARGLSQLAETSRTPVMVGMNRRHYSVIDKALAELGGLRAVTAVFVEWSEDPAHLLGNREMSSEQVEKMVFGNSLHGLDLLSFLSGDISRLKLNTTVVNRERFRWMMAAQGISNRGVLASFQSTWDCPGGWRLTLCGRGKRFVFSPLERCVVFERGNSDRILQNDEVDGRFKPGFYKQASCFLQIAEKRTVQNSFGLDTVIPAMQLAERLTMSCLNEEIHQR